MAKQANFGGLYYSGQYILHLKLAHPIDGYRVELSYIHEALDRKFERKQIPMIFQVSLNKVNEYAEPDRDDIILYSDEAAYSVAYGLQKFVSKYYCNDTFGFFAKLGGCKDLATFKKLPNLDTRNYFLSNMLQVPTRFGEEPTFARP